MKRTLTLLVLGALLLTLVPGVSLAADDIKISQVDETTFNDQVQQAPVMTITNQGAGPVTITIAVFDEVARAVIDTQTLTLQAGDAPFEVLGRVYKPLTHNGQINTYRYDITTAGGLKRTLYFAQIMHIDTKVNPNVISYTHTKNPSYPKNTVSSFGPQFRVVSPTLTDKWYMFTPIDLTIQGRQTFPLIGGNVRIVGDVFVDVYGDTVNVTYQYSFEHAQHTKVKRESEYLNFFPAFSTITTVEPEQLPSAFAFNQPFSIANQLGGDTNVLMFIRNEESFYRYPTPTQEMPRLFPNREEWKTLRGQMLSIMDPMEGLNFGNEHNYAD